MIKKVSTNEEIDNTKSAVQLVVLTIFSAPLHFFLLRGCLKTSFFPSSIGLGFLNPRSHRHHSLLHAVKKSTSKVEQLWRERDLGIREREKRWEIRNFSGVNYLN